MASFQVISIRKPDALSNHRDITHITYCESQFNPRVLISVEDAIRRVDDNHKEFYIRAASGIIYLEVERPSGEKPFLRTRISYKDTDNLLRLQAC